MLACIYLVRFVDDDHSTDVMYAFDTAADAQESLGNAMLDWCLGVLEVEDVSAEDRALIATVLALVEGEKPLEALDAWMQTRRTHDQTIFYGKAWLHPAIGIPNAELREMVRHGLAGLKGA